MIRTKHFFVAVCGMVLAMSIVGMQINTNETKDMVATSKVSFTTPKDVYSVVLHDADGDTRDIQRSLFVASVRSALLRDLGKKKNDPVIIEKEIPDVPVTPTPTPTVPAPLIEVVSDATVATSTYSVDSLRESYLGTTTASTSAHE